MKQITESTIRRMMRSAGPVQKRLLQRALDKIETRRQWKRQREARRPKTLREVFALEEKGGA